MQTWQDKFYELAELYLESEALLKYACNRLLSGRSELEASFAKEISETKKEAFHLDARKTINRIIAPPKEDERLEVVKKLKSDLSDIRKKQRAAKVKRMPLKDIITI